MSGPPASEPEPSDADNLPEEFRDLEIPKLAWTTTGLNWFEGTLKTPRGVYFEIGISTEDLFREFPEQSTPVEREVVERRGALRFLTAEDVFDERRKRGRPRLSVRDAMAIEVAMIANTPDGLPQAQAELERKLSEFCGKLGQYPGEQTIRRFVRPYYEALRNRHRRGN